MAAHLFCFPCRAAGFLFLCIPELTRSEENLAAFGELSDQNKRTRLSGPSYADTLMKPLRELGLVDLAVRSGIGRLLSGYLQNCQVSHWLSGKLLAGLSTLQTVRLLPVRAAAASPARSSLLCCSCRGAKKRKMSPPYCSPALAPARRAGPAPASPSLWCRTACCAQLWSAASSPQKLLLAQQFGAVG